MASYNSGFNPPSRQEEAGRGRRLGIYTQPVVEKKAQREVDVAHISGSVDSRRRAQTPQQTGLPRPSMRDPPSLRPKPEAQKSSSSFGFGKSVAKPITVPAPQLKGKSSRNVLRRKPSSLAQPAPDSTLPKPSIPGASKSTERRPSVDSSLRSAEAYNEIFTRPGARASSAVREPRAVIPELDRYRSRPEQHVGPSRTVELPHKLSTQDLPPPFPGTVVTPVYSGGSSHHRYSGYSGSGYSVSPSTRFSESPGPGGAYSRDTTPTSMSSQSPGIFLPVKTTTPRLRQGSAPLANKPPVSSVTRRRGGSITEIDAMISPIDSSGLSIVRESLTSSSSNSTVKGDGKGKEKDSEKKKKKRLSPLPPSPPSPPPRKSSQKFKKPSPGDFDSPSKTSQSPANPLMMSPPTQVDSPSKPSKLVKPAVMSTSELPQPKLTRPQAKNTPPTRPSREGAPDLPSQFVEPINIIQSNLSGLHFSPDRRRSGIPSPLQVQTNFRPQASRLPSRNPSPGPIAPSPREATPAPSGLGIIPDLRPRQPSSSRGTTPSPSTASRSRFGLFTRRTKTEPVLDSKDKGPRKGPAAGTGHEGYGKYAHRGRSSSATGQGRHERNLSIATSSSQESLASTTATHDPFLLHRMSPVIIAGGGEIIENRNSGSELYRTESNTSLLLGRPSMDSRGSSKSNLSHEVSRTTLWPSALPKESTRRTSAIAAVKGRRPSDSSDDGYRQNTLALRRSVQRLGDAAAALNLPRPLNIPRTGMSPSMTSLDASLMSDDSRFATEAEVVRGRKAQLTKPKKLEKRQKSPTKWNFFHRSKPAAKTAAPAMAVSVGKAAPKAVPHYAMMDSSDEQQEVDSADLEDLLRDAAVVSLSNEELDALQFGYDRENMRRIEDLRIDVPTPDPVPAPLFSSPEPITTPDLAQRELHLVKETAPVRPSRLPQVGRIPKVISARPETTSPKSFSRPFARLSVAHPQQLLVADKESLAVGPSPPKSSTPEPVVENILRQDTTDSRTESTISHRDFLAFSPRKNSEATTSSSGGLSLVIPTANVPEIDAEEDEVWDEYDDLIENDDTMKAPVSATSSHGVPFQYESFETRRVRKSKLRPKESPTLTEAPKITEPELDRASHITSSSVYSQEMNSRLREALTTLPTPTTPMSFTDFFSGYGDRNNSLISSGPRPRRSSQSGSRKSNSSENSRTLSGIISIEEQENPSPRSQVNLRVGSMTVSKWLTFGHVLFSPAREEIIHMDRGSMKAHSILVIDGLGNDDWSFYAAETYPNSTFYNLSPTQPLSPSSSNRNSASLPLSPANHRQIQHLSPTIKFPFPSSFFDIVVFRFPAAMSENGYKTIISESKRTLKPGGYLEMAILDLDMLNMGNRGRRAVRGLKVKMQVAEPAVMLGSASDTVLRLVGKRGFTDVKTCNVGVPVASTIASPVTSAGADKGKGKAKAQELSLADLLKNDSPSSDEGITKMVARVGRWWYTRCYESTVLPVVTSPNPNTDGTEKVEERSMWYADGGRLLSECEKRNASFKLVVAYAQKPALGAGVGSLGRGNGGSGAGASGGATESEGKGKGRKRGMSV